MDIKLNIFRNHNAYYISSVYGRHLYAIYLNQTKTFKKKSNII